MKKATPSPGKRKPTAPKPGTRKYSAHSVLRGMTDLVRGLHDLEQRAAQQFQPVVDYILRTGAQDSQRIEHTLDRLLDFCGHEAVLTMYKQLCRHYWPIDPEATAHYVNGYRERWDSDEQAGQA